MGSVSLALQWMLTTAGALTLAGVVMEILSASTIGAPTLPNYLLAAAAVGSPVGEEPATWRPGSFGLGYWIPVTGAAFGVAWVVTFALVAAVFFIELFLSLPRLGIELGRPAPSAPG